MSFSQKVKEDLLKKANDDEIADKLEIEAMLRFGGEVIISKPMKLSFTCNLMSVVRHFIKLCKQYYPIEYEIASRTISRLDNHTVYSCRIDEGAERIIYDLDIISQGSYYREGTLSVKQRAAYLRGAFLVRGTVNDPASKSYHLEISSNNETEILYVQRLMNSFDFDARISKRKNYLITYVKANNVIGDFLYLIGATATMSYYEDVLITKEIKATAKRTVNLDVANQDKTNEASKDQLKYIKYLEYNYPLEKLDSKILMVMKIRKEYPEHSLTQLLEIIHDEYDPKLTKSGLNHRFRKIKELALQDMEKKKEE
jgi:DNA-binding protein WhiA